MPESTSSLSRRLSTLWKKPDFTAFFSQYSKRKPLKIKKGGTIFYEGDLSEKIYCVIKGYVKLYRLSESGRDAAIYLYGPGSILGLRSITSEDGILRHSAEALTDCEISSISKDEYLRILSEHPEHVVDLMHSFIQRLNHAERKLEGFILTDTTARVASFFVDCALRFGEKQDKNIVLPIPFTHQRIAEFVGAFRETITIAINKLEDEKLISLDKGKVTIFNLKKLKQKTHINDSL